MLLMHLKHLPLRVNNLPFASNERQALAWASALLVARAHLPSRMMMRLILLVPHELLLIDCLDLVFAFLSINPYLLMSIRTTSHVIQTMFQGVFVSRVAEGGVAAKAGLLVGDKILSVR